MKSEHIRQRIALIAGLVFVASAAGAVTDESVRAELVRLEKAKGLAIAFYDNVLGVVSFKKRGYYELGKLVPMGSSAGTVSFDGSEVAINSSNWGPGYRDHTRSLDIVATDGRGIREYREALASEGCWSRDKSKLDITIFNPPESHVGILDLGSRKIHAFAPQMNYETSHFNSQCWSPDNKELVFETDGKVQVYEIEKDQMRTLAVGTQPTWSPDGNWISYRDRDDYYVIPPSGDGKKKLFHKRRAVSALFWSPDSRFVAYVHEDLLALDVEFYHLMVRRLEDGDEDWVADGVACCINYQWIENPDLLKRALAEGKR